MNRKVLISTAAVLCLAVSSPATFAQTARSTKIAIINIQDAITRTLEGQKLAKDLQGKYGPTRDKLERLQGEIQSLRDQLSRGANTMSEDARRKLAREMQTKERDLKRDSEDAQAEFNQAQQAALGDISGKLMTVIDKYAKENSFAIVLDVSSPQSPVLYAVNEILITNNIIERYDKDHPAGAAAAAASPAAKPAP
jgi:outer membrane protein